VIARALYDRLIVLSGYVKVWTSYALCEAEAFPLPRAEWDEVIRMRMRKTKMIHGELALVRQVFKRGYKDQEPVCF